jgi:hypothetical protein
VLATRLQALSSEGEKICQERSHRMLSCLLYVQLKFASRSPTRCIPGDDASHASRSHLADVVQIQPPGPIARRGPPVYGAGPGFKLRSKRVLSSSYASSLTPHRLAIPTKKQSDAPLVPEL